MQHVKHPLISDLLVRIRDETTPNAEFARALAEVTTFLVIEATRDLPTTPTKVKTPVAVAVGEKLAGPSPMLVPILRAGAGMSPTARHMIPHSEEGYIAIGRNEETALPTVTGMKLPNSLAGRLVIITDPMLATGGSLVEAVNAVKAKGATDIRALILVAAPEGVTRMEDAHPDVKLYVAALDDHLNEKKYIVPGLGDAGDRIFGTFEG